MTITELLESWKGRAEKAEAELARVQRELDHKKMWANEIAACAKEELEKAHKEIERVQLERDHYKNKVERYREVLGVNTNESICEAAERVQAQCAEMREALKHWQRHFQASVPANADQQEESAEDFTAAWYETERALSEDAGTGYVRKEDVVPLLQAASVLCERAPVEPYPKEWDTDPVYRLHVPYCELIVLAKALARTKGLTEPASGKPSNQP